MLYVHPLIQDLGLVFFLVATTFYTEERDLEVRLPEGTQGEAITQEGGPYVVNVRQGGVIVVANKIMTMDELEKELQQLRQTRKPKVEVRGDTQAQHGSIMAVLNLCKRLGIVDFALTQRIVKER